MKEKSGVLTNRELHRMEGALLCIHIFVLLLSTFSCYNEKERAFSFSQSGAPKMRNMIFSFILDARRLISWIPASKGVSSLYLSNV